MLFFYNCSVCVNETLINNIEVLNFGSEPEESRCHINKFVKETTKDIIKEFLPPNYITPQTIAVLVNAAFFKGLWNEKFRKEDTKQEFFYKDIDTPISVEMMKQSGRFNKGIIFY